MMINGRRLFVLALIYLGSLLIVAAVFARVPQGERAQSQPSAPASASPAPPPQPMTIGLTPLGQKSVENIQLRFQLLQRDLKDLEKEECGAQGLQPGECRLDAERGLLMVRRAFTAAASGSPKPSAPNTAPPKTGVFPSPAAPAPMPKARDAQQK